MTHNKYTFLLIPILMIAFHPVFAQADDFDFMAENEKAMTQNAGVLAIQPLPVTTTATTPPQENTSKPAEKTCQKWQTKNQKGDCIDSLDYRKCTKQNSNRNRHWDEQQNKCVCDESTKQWDNTLGICKLTQDAKETEQATNKARKGMVCTDATKHHLLATYDENSECVVKSCVAGYKLESGACVQKTDEEKKAASQKKGMVCTDATKHHLLATYNENRKCVVKSCVFGYDVNEEKNECEEDKSDELTTTLEKAISELTTEFQAKVSQLQPSNGEE